MTIDYHYITCRMKIISLYTAIIRSLATIFFQNQQMSLQAVGDGCIEYFHQQM